MGVKAWARGSSATLSRPAPNAPSEIKFEESAAIVVRVEVGWFEGEDADNSCPDG
jgi:hypothetical protein